MASIRKAKKQAKKEGRVFVDPTRERRKLLVSVNKNIKEANRRLRALDRKGYYNSFSSKKLFERLEGKAGALQKINNKVVAIRINKRMTMTDLTAVNKATTSFLKGKTSRAFGIEEVKRKTKDSMLKTFKQKNSKITEQDIEDYYEMLTNKDFDTFADLTSASDVWGVITEAIDNDWDSNKFASQLMTIIPSDPEERKKKLKKLTGVTDQDIREKALRLYEKYVL